MNDYVVPCCTGISRDHWHKRRATGGKRAPIRKKRKYELGRPAANTKVNVYIITSLINILNGLVYLTKYQ